MTEYMFPIGGDEDEVFIWTHAQASISQAFKKGKIDIRIKEPDGISIYRPSYVCFTSSGEVTIVANGDSVEYV